MRIAIVQGHPDPSEARLDRALANRYAEAARAIGHEVRRIDVARMDFPLLRVPEDFYGGEPPAEIREAQQDIAWADHVVFFYPLWIGDKPALLEAFIERTFRPGFAEEFTDAARFPKKLLTGKSARIVVSMGMPALVYRTYCGAHTLKAFALNLKLVGFAPVYETIVGGTAGSTEKTRRRWIERMAVLAQRDGLPRSPARAARAPAGVLAAASVVALGAYAAYVASAWSHFGDGKRSVSVLDEAMPEYDLRMDHEIHIQAPAAVAYRSLHDVELARSPVVRALFRARALLLGARNVERPMPRGLPESLEAMGWKVLAADPGHELALSTVTQPWRANPVFVGLPPDEFARFDEPGFVKIALTLRVDPLGPDACIARTETRVQTTDPHSRRRFRRYWALLSPGMELIRIVLLRQLRAAAQARHGRALSQG